LQTLTALPFKWYWFWHLCIKNTILNVIVSTYQSITGTGVKAVQQLENEYAGVKGEMAYKYPIHRNAIPQCDSFEENGYTKEEMKLVRETQKLETKRLPLLQQRFVCLS
jgi:aspartate-semialdehyde dehydrogenase